MGDSGRSPENPEPPGPPLEDSSDAPNRAGALQVGQVPLRSAGEPVIVSDLTGGRPEDANTRVSRAPPCGPAGEEGAGSGAPGHLAFTHSPVGPLGTPPSCRGSSSSRVRVVGGTHRCRQSQMLVLTLKTRACLRCPPSRPGLTGPSPSPLGALCPVPTVAAPASLCYPVFESAVGPGAPASLRIRSLSAGLPAAPHSQASPPSLHDLGMTLPSWTSVSRSGKQKLLTGTEQLTVLAVPGVMLLKARATDQPYGCLSGLVPFPETSWFTALL